MRTLYVTLIGLASCAMLASADVSSDEASRLNAAASTVRELRASPDKGIPADMFKPTDCVAVIPGLKKAAFIVGGEYGKGVVSCRSGQTWSAPAFLEMEKGSAGVQIGGEAVDLVLLVMNRSGLDKLLGDKMTLGTDASVAAGPVGRDAAAATDARMTAQILAYSRAKGVFAGIDISGGSLRADKKANADAYGAAVTARDVLDSKVMPPAAAAGFLKALGPETQGTSGRK